MNTGIWFRSRAICNANSPLGVTIGRSILKRRHLGDLRLSFELLFGGVCISNLLSMTFEYGRVVAEEWQQLQKLAVDQEMPWLWKLAWSLFVCQNTDNSHRGASDVGPLYAALSKRQENSRLWTLNVAQTLKCGILVRLGSFSEMSVLQIVVTFFWHGKTVTALHNLHKCPGKWVRLIRGVTELDRGNVGILTDTALRQRGKIYSNSWSDLEGFLSFCAPFKLSQYQPVW